MLENVTVKNKWNIILGVWSFLNAAILRDRTCMLCEGTGLSDSGCRERKIWWRWYSRGLQHDSAYACHSAQAVCCILNWQRLVLKQKLKSWYHTQPLEGAPQQWVPITMVLCCACSFVHTQFYGSQCRGPMKDKGESREDVSFWGLTSDTNLVVALLRVFSMGVASA